MSNELVPVGDLERMARAMTASKLFGIQNAEQALALMLVAQAEGLHPATAARDYHIIQGRPSLKADAMLARYLSSGGKIEWHDHTDEKVSATFSHPAGGSLRIEWDKARAKQAGLGGKDMWLKYPRQMLRARVISEGIRATNPGISIGIYTPEEVQDMGKEPAPPAKREPKDMGRAEVVDADTGEITSTAAAQELPSGAVSTQPVQQPAAAAPHARGTVSGHASEDDLSILPLNPTRKTQRDEDATALSECPTLQELADVFKTLYSSAKGDNERRVWLVTLKDARKAALSAGIEDFRAGLEKAPA